jgi:type IV pilus assembly protein PilP
MSDLEDYVKQVKARPGGPIEPLPEIKSYESFVYDASTLRSPFMPDVPVAADAGAGGSGVRPDTTRNREFLEQFPLDTLRMVGTLESGGEFFGLVQDKDGLVHRVLPGNHLGQNDGRILRVTPATIELVEIVSDGMGGYFERPAAVALDK